MKKYLGKIKYVILTTLIVLFLFTTVAYSGLASKLAITSEVMFRALADIRVTNIKLEKTTGNALESYEPKYNVDATTTGFELPSADSSITYRVTVTNRGKRNQTIYEFIKNSINADGVNIKIEGYTEKDIIPYESSIDFLITFTTTNPSNQTINVIEKYDFREVYTIEYDANGGTNAPKEQIKYQKEDIALREEIPTRGTYKFIGWSETQGSETAEYKAGGAYTLDKDVILYAVWQKNATKLDLNYNVDGTWYYSGYNNRIQTGIKVNGEDQGYLNDFGQTYDYGTSYEIYGFKIDGEKIPYSKKYTVDGTNHLGIYFNTMNFTVNDESLGSISHEQLIVIPGTTYTVSNSTITMSDGRIVTASPKTVTGYTTKFTGYTITPNSTTINAKTTVKANFTKEANTYKITLDNKSATTAGTTLIYEKYNTGIYLDSDLKTAMTTTTNPITKPVKKGYTFKGYYTKENGQGDQIITADGYITEVITNTTYTANTTLYAYYVDEEKPTLTLTNSSNENWTNKDVTITLNGADPGSGIKEYQWKENGAWTTRAVSITNGVGSITYTVDRNLEIEFRVIDNAGNISDVKKTYVRRDTVAPKIELNGTASSSEINNSNSVTIPIKITETASGMNSTEFTASDISVLINGTAVNPSTKTLTYNSVSNGVYSYTLTLSGITLNGKVILEIASGAVKDIATNSSVKTTLDPSIIVSNAYTISLNGNGATTAGTTAIYEKYNTGIYLDSVLANAMTTSENPITKPSKSAYTISYNANGTGVTVSNESFTPTFNGYYTATSSGTKMIDSNGYITSNLINTKYTANTTLYAQWNQNYTLSTISKTGYTCSWNTKSDGTGTKYNSGATASITANTTLYAICTANTYKVTFNPNGGKVSPTYKLVTFDSNYGKDSTLPTPTRADSTDSASGKTISYVFEGWYTAANGGTKVTDETLVNTASNHSIYAHWISKPIITGGSADWINKEVNIALEVPSTSDTGSVKYQYYVSTSNSSQVGGEWKDTSASGYAPVSSNGIHYVFYRAISSAGVYSNVSNYRMVRIDTEKPTISVTGNPTSWVTTDVTLKVSASDSVSGLSSVTVNGKDLSLNDGVVNYTVSANGTYTFVATDVAGNTTTQSVVVSKIDKVTPTAPVITGGSTTYSDTNDAKGVKVYVKTAGTTGPSGIKEYEIQAHNYLTDITPKFRKTVSGFTISDKTYTTTNSDPYIRFDDFGPNGVYFNNVIIAFTQPTTKDISLRVYAWAKGSSPSAGQKISVTVPKGTNGWYYVPNFTAGTYDGLQFNFGGTAGDTYTINSFRYVNSTSSSKASDNYAYTESRRGQTGIYYRTVANNGLKSSWTTLDANSWAYISKAVAESNGFRYTTLQKAIDFAKNNTATSISVLKDTAENINIASTKNIVLNGNSHTNEVASGVSFTNAGTLTINNEQIVSNSGRALYVSSGTVSIANNSLYIVSTSNGQAIYVNGGTVNVTSGNFASHKNSCVVLHSGTLNVKGGKFEVGANSTNIVLFESGTFNMTAGTLGSTGDDYGINCPSSIKIAAGNSGTTTISGGTINGCIGVNQYSTATGKINITGKSTVINSLHTGILMQSKKSGLLSVGTSGSTDTEHPRINATEYYAIDMGDSTAKFTMYSGRLVSDRSTTFVGSHNSITGKKFTTTKAANGRYYTIWK